MKRAAEKAKGNDLFQMLQDKDRCKNHPLSGKGVVFMGKEVDGLGEDPFRIRDTRTGRNNGRIYPYYDDAVYRIDGREGE